MKKLVKSAFAIFCFVISIDAHALKFVPSNKAIVGLNDAMANLKQQTAIPVLFPDKIPVSSQVNAQTKFFLSTIVFPNGNGYSISVDKTANCNGAKYCSIGTITAQKGERPQIYSDMNGADLTVPIVLYQGIKGYYTPDHTEADFWPTQIEFKKGLVLYRVSWVVMDMSQEKYVISMLANSMLQAGPY
jgi:hypothetical protein